MADKKISQLTALAAANLAPSTDVLAIVDTSATETKKIVAQDLINGVLNVASAVGIGTASPGYKLHVVDNSTGTQVRVASSSSGGTSQSFINTATNGRSYRIGSNFVTGTGEFALYDDTAGAARLTVDSSGNLGLGVTPSAWNSSFRAMQLGNSGFIFGRSSQTQMEMGNNAVFDATDTRWEYITTNTAQRYLQDATSGAHQWFIAPSGTAGNAITFTQAMTLDASGNLLVGGTGGGNRLVVSNTTDISMSSGAAGQARFEGNGYSFAIAMNADGAALYTNSAARGIIFGTDETERGRFTAGGYFKASNTGTYLNATGAYHELRSNDTSYVARIDNSHPSSPDGAIISFSGASPDNNTEYFLLCTDTTADRCYIWSDGDLANHDGVYGTISDERLKQDIVDASSQWDDLKAIRFRKYRMKTDVEANPDAPAMFGVVAQELAQVCPGLVDEHPNMKTVEVTDEEGNVTQTQEPDGTTTMTVKSSILLMKAAKALQEAMARIEQLEADMAALKASA